MKMKTYKHTNKIILGLFLTFSIISCQEQEAQEGEVVYSETFNLDELEDSSESDDDFVLKYGDFLKSTIDVYNIEDSEILNDNSKMNTESNNLNQSIEFEFEYSAGKSRYYIMNNLTKFHDVNDIDKGWELGESSFWSGLLNKVQKESFTEYKNHKINSIGDYSEYSEVPSGNKIMVIWHIKWRKLILHFDQLVDPEQKSDLLKKIQESFEKIKDAYNIVDQEKIDQVVDKAIDDIKNEGL